MKQLVSIINNFTKIEFDKGSFDSWCVFLTTPEKARYAPKDTEYFTFLKEMASKYGVKKVYSDFKKIYHKTTSALKPEIFEIISGISKTYPDNLLEMEIWLTIIYAGMVAEENKENAILKKRVKRLGIHQLLIDGFTPEEAAVYSKGKTWKELDITMWEKGF
jgi:hypothetical protein